MNHDRERRKFYRVRFPVEDRPTLKIGQDSYVVTELSEGGLRMLEGGHLRGVIDGDLIYSDGRRQTVVGVVKRISGRETIVCDLRGVTFRDMMDEQRRLVRTYPFLA